MRHTIIYYLPIVILSVMLSMQSCSDVDTPEAAEASPYITFAMPGGSSVSAWQREVQGRGSDTDLDCDMPATIGVYGFNDAGTGSTVFDNRQMYYVNYLEAGYSGFDGIFETRNNLWPYYNPVPWVADAQYRFFAYGPYTADVSVADQTYDGLNTAVFTGIPYFSGKELLVAKNLVDYQSRAVGNDVQEFTLTHPMSWLRLNFKLGPKYADMRIIRITRIEIVNPINQTLQLEVSYSDGDARYTWSLDGGSASETIEIEQGPGIASDGYLELSKATNSSYQPYGGFFGCALNTYKVNSLDINVTYDVFDLTGQLLRSEETVSNTISLKKSYQLRAGYMYDINLVVEPTFLYVLSDNDPTADGTLVVNDER